MQEMVWAIPGFLGLPNDWNILKLKQLKGINLHDFSWASLSEWGEHFNRWVLEQNQTFNVLMGYSLGGRLALHALIDRPNQWKAAIIISAHTGQLSDKERGKRLLEDQKWALRFQNEEWHSLMQAWNGQEIFKQDSFQFSREESYYDRSQLAAILKQGTLAKQQELYQQIAELAIPILWMTGERDDRYNQLAETLSFAHPLSRWEKVPNAGHRVPWSQPVHVRKQIELFLNGILGINQ